MQFKKKPLAQLMAAIGLAASVSTPVLGVTLQEVVQQTLTSNPDLLTDSTERLVRDEELQEARGGYFPNLDLIAGYGRERSNNPATDNDWKWLTRKEAGVVATQLLFDGMFTPAEVERQTARINSQAHRVNGVAQNITADAVEVYLNVMRERTLTRLAEENLEVHRRIHDQIRVRSESGVGRRADLAQIEARLALAESNLVADQTNLMDAETSYLRVIGELPQDLEPVPHLRERLPETLDQALEQAKANNAILKSAGADVEAAMAQNKAAKSANYPHFDLELARTWNENIDGVKADEDDYRAMVLLRWNLLRGGSDQARIKRTAQQINEAKEIRNSTHRQVVESVRLSWAAYQAAEKQRPYLQQHVDQSRKTRDAYGKQFKIGQRTLLDLLNTENELFEASRNAENNNYDGLFAEYRLLRGMSTLVQALELQLPQEANPL